MTLRVSIAAGILFALSYVLAGVIGLGLSGAPRAYADHSDGHLAGWGVGIEALNFQLIDNYAPTVCSSGFPNSTSSAVSSWKAAIHNQVFSYTGCSANIRVSTDNFASRCGSGAHACTDPATVAGSPLYEIILPVNIRMNPSIQSDGGAHTTRDIAHELGHALGFADYNGCPSGATLMDGTEACWYTTPQSLDVQNFHSAYHIDAANPASGYSPGAGKIHMSWNNGWIHNERGVSVWRWTGSQYLFADYVHGRDVTYYESPTFYREPAGCWWFAAFHEGFAEDPNYRWGDPAWAYICVQ